MNRLIVFAATAALVAGGASAHVHKAWRRHHHRAYAQLHPTWRHHHRYAYLRRHHGDAYAGRSGPTYAWGEPPAYAGPGAYQQPPGAYQQAPADVGQAPPTAYAGPSPVYVRARRGYGREAWPGETSPGADTSVRLRGFADPTTGVTAAPNPNNVSDQIPSRGPDYEGVPSDWPY